MSCYSRQTIYCTACGRKMHVEIPHAIGRDCKVCSLECLRAWGLKRARSILGEPENEPENDT